MRFLRVEQMRVGEAGLQIPNMVPVPESDVKQVRREQAGVCGVVVWSPTIQVAMPRR